MPEINHNHDEKMLNKQTATNREEKNENNSEKSTLSEIMLILSR